MQNFSLERIMALGSFPLLLSTLQPTRQRRVALELVDNLAASGTRIAQARHVSMLLKFLRPLVIAGGAPNDAVRCSLQPRAPHMHKQIVTALD
jgi:hypothetical protein